MTLYLIGLGLGTWKNITLEGIEILHKCNKIFFENYTSLYGSSIKELEKNIGKTVIPISRKELEESDILLKDAKKNNAALLVIGDPLSATTHCEILLRAKENKIVCKVIHNTSIINAISDTGLQLYKFGRVISLPFIDNDLPKSVYDNISGNKKLGLHSLILLDIRSDESRFMTISQAVEILLKMEDKYKGKTVNKKQRWVACARIGMDDKKIVFDIPEKLLKVDFGKPPHCLIIPGNLHFIEEEFLDKL